jgi:glycosyltransferase involved in cell wall biosynthesis
MLKVLILSDLYPPFFIGGHEIRCKIIADSLINKGHDVHIITSDYKNKFKKVTENKVYRILHNLSFKNLNSRINQIKYSLQGRMNYRITREKIKTINPNVAYIGQLNGISIYPLTAIEENKIPMVHHIGNYYIVDLFNNTLHENNWLKRKYKQTILGHANHKYNYFKNIIVDSRSMLQTYKNNGFESNNITIIPSISTPFGYIPQKTKRDYNGIQKFIVCWKNML